MDIRTRTILLWSGVAILIVAGIVTLSFSFGGSKDTSTDDLNAVYTNAASTVAAQQQTMQAATPSPALSSPTATLTLLPSPTFQQQVPTLLLTSVGVATSCDSAVYLSDVTIPDGTTIPAGQSFTKTWKVSNTGSCAWMATYQLVFISGDSLGGKATAIGKVVNPGESADISVVLTSSSATGNITGTWKLSNDKSQPFGDSLTVVINSGTTGMVSVTPTSFTPTTAPVATTAVPTNTPLPTDTPVPTATLRKSV